MFLHAQFLSILVLLSFIDTKPVPLLPAPALPKFSKMALYCHNCNFHLGPENGLPYVPDVLDKIALAMGIPSAVEILYKLQSNGVLTNRSPELAEAGAYHVLATIAKFKMLPPGTHYVVDPYMKAPRTLMLLYGQLKVAAMKGDIQTIYQTLKNPSTILTQLYSKMKWGPAPSDVFTVPSYDIYKQSKLSVDQILHLWGGNEHINLHQGWNDKMLAKAIHITSINDKDYVKENNGVTLGCYNTKGEYPEADWYPGALHFHSLFK